MGGSSVDPPPSFSSIGAATDDSTAKEMVIREDNMKFPQSIKRERPKPETRVEVSSRAVQNLDPNAPRNRRASGNSQRHPSPGPRLITSSDEKDEKESYYLNTDGSGSDSESDTSSRDSRRPELGLVIRTTDLTVPSHALTLRPHSPSSFRSSRGSFGEDDAVRSMAQRQRSLESGNETGTEIVTVTATVSVNVIMRDGIGKETMIGEIEIEKGRGRGRGDAILRHRLRRLRDRVRGVTPGIGPRRRRRRGAAGRSI